MVEIKWKFQSLTLLGLGEVLWQEGKLFRKNGARVLEMGARLKFGRTHGYGDPIHSKFLANHQRSSDLIHFDWL